MIRFFKQRLLIVSFPILFLYAVNCFGQQGTKVEKYYWKTGRGVNAKMNLTKLDIADLKSWNVNLLRINTSSLPLMEMKPPYKMNQNAFTYLDTLLNWCEEAGISVIINPSPFPGMENQSTILDNDSQNFKYHDIIVKIWDTISNRYKNRGRVIAAYDILNEPETSPVLKAGTTGDLNLLYNKVIKAIRKNDSVHTISLALPHYKKDGKEYSYYKGIDLIKLPQDDNIVLQSHTYMPVEFTHQNIWKEGQPVQYPCKIDGIKWNLKRLRKEQSELIAFSKQNKNIPILIGEFSCPRWTGKDGVKYLKDIIKIAEENNWSWTYHAFRESEVWDAELSQTNRNDFNKDASNSRLQLLKASFAKNQNKQDD